MLPTEKGPDTRDTLCLASLTSEGSLPTRTQNYCQMQLSATSDLLLCVSPISMSLYL